MSSCGKGRHAQGTVIRASSAHFVTAGKPTLVPFQPGSRVLIQRPALPE
jgi:hypothetical protein